MDMLDIKTYLALDAEIKNLDAEIKELKQRKSEIEAKLIRQFEEDGLQNMSIDGKTVYLNRMVTARVLDREAVVNILRESDAAELITVNHQSFGGYVRGKVKDYEEEFPDEALTMTKEDLARAALGELGNHVELNELFNVRVRKS